MGRLFGTDGVRGTYGVDLTDELARSLGAAAASVLGKDHGEPTIIIGRDTRASGPALERALASGITAAGGRAVTAGIIPTAGVAHVVRAFDAQAGAVISASHNPAQDNGIKFFGPDGMKLADEIEATIEAALEPVPDGTSLPEELLDAEDRYLAFLLDGVPSLEGLRVVVDCANGAASNVAPEAYRLAGAHVTVIGADPDGTNINDHCGSTHPELLQKAVEVHGAHIGLAHDGDADRLIAVDARGTIVDGDQVLGICALDMRTRDALPKNAVVTTVMANLGFRNAMAEARIDVTETAVGDRYVLAAMLKNGITIGGEQSGHIVFLDKHTTGDGILTALELMSVVVRTGSGLTELAAAIPRYPQVLLNVKVKDRTALEGSGAVADAIAEAEDALGTSGRILVRPSGTEQLIRVMVEAPDEQVARDTAERVAETVRDALA